MFPGLCPDLVAGEGADPRGRGGLTGLDQHSCDNQDTRAILKGRRAVSSFPKSLPGNNEEQTLIPQLPCRRVLGTCLHAESWLLDPLSTGRN